MGEKILIEGRINNLPTTLKRVFTIVGIVVAIIIFFPICRTHHIITYMIDDILWVIDLMLYLFLTALGFVLFFVIGKIVYYALSKVQIVVTDKRVYGKVAFGKQVDLPLDSISAVGTNMFNGISVATSSGKIKFASIDNRDEVHKVISRLLIERQSENKEGKSMVSQSAQNNVDELKKYKELLDSGIITQDEFDTKKRQLLGL